MTQINTYEFDVLSSIQSLRARRLHVTVDAVTDDMRKKRSLQTTSDFAVSVVGGLTSLAFLMGARKLGNYFNKLCGDIQMATKFPRDEDTREAIIKLKQDHLIGTTGADNAKPESYYVSFRGLQVLKGKDPDNMTIEPV